MRHGVRRFCPAHVHIRVARFAENSCGSRVRKLGNICDFACMLLHRAAVKAWNSTFGL